jgi:hypothetical protein
VELDNLTQLIQSAEVAEWFQVNEVKAVLQDSLLQNLSVRTCATILIGCLGAKLEHAQKENHC